MTSPGPDPVKVLVESLRIYSPTEHEARFASYLGRVLKQLGYRRIRKDSAGNMIGEIGNGKTKLLLCGHMDTVPGDLPVRKTAAAIFGRGAADAKSPLCALMLAGAASSDAGVHITFAGATEEEGEGKGINQLMKTGSKFDYAVFGEPSGAPRVTVGYRGRVSLYITVRTKGGHAGSPWAHRSAFSEFNSMLARVKEYEASMGIPGDNFRSLSVSPTMIKAGTSHNVVPNLCEATLDLRIPPQMKAKDAIGQIQTVAEIEEDGLSIKVKPGEATEAYQADVNSTLVRAFQRAILLRLKSKPTLIRKTGTGDMNTFAQRNRAECVTYGPGFSKTSHTDSEMVEIEDYLSSIEVLKEAISQLGRLNRRSPK